MGLGWATVSALVVWVLGQSLRGYWSMAVAVWRLTRRRVGF